MQDTAWQTGRAGGRHEEEALPGWSCLGSIRAVGGIYLEKGETNPERDGDQVIEEEEEIHKAKGYTTRIG